MAKNKKLESKIEILEDANDKLECAVFMYKDMVMTTLSILHRSSVLAEQQAEYIRWMRERDNESTTGARP